MNKEQMNVYLHCSALCRYVVSLLPGLRTRTNSGAPEFRGEETPSNSATTPRDGGGLTYTASQDRDVLLMLRFLGS